MKAPAFWSNSPYAPGWQARVLAPVGWLYASATARRLKRTKAYIATVPVICVGNVNVGGTGKTPTVIALGDKLRSRGMTPHVVSRGYGGRMSGPVQVDERHHTALDVGDEPLLLSNFGPVWVSHDRSAGVRQAEANGADVILLDDGFQNPHVHKDVSILVVNARSGFGNGRIIPAGPLREPVAVAMKRADVVLTVGKPDEQTEFDRLWLQEVTCPRIAGSLQPLPMGMDWHGLDALAFAGIGNPERFFGTLRDLGANLIRTQALDDHQPLTEALMKRLMTEAKGLGAQLVTTEKDAVRLPVGIRPNVLTLPVRLQIEDWTELDQVIARAGIGTIPAIS